jgi:uncharacterized protein YndB with AHSA1/START domain
MSNRSAHHATFVIDRTYDAPLVRVFQAWADPKAKAAWFAGPRDKWTEKLRESDFRIGGRERVRGAFTDGHTSTFDAHYQDIVVNERIIYSYDMHLDEKRISVSLATIEFEPAGKGTRLIVTEQGVFLDGYDGAADREAGTRFLLDTLEVSLRTP